MDRNEFLRRLGQALGAMPEDERQDILADYQAYFEDARADGRDEAAVAAALGDPERLARELMAERRLQAWERHKTPGNLWPALAAVAGLGVLNMLLLVPYLFFMTLLTSLWLGALGMLLAGVLMTGGWASNALFGWPVLHERMLHEQRMTPPGMADIRIDGDDQAHIVIHADASGAHVRIDASDARGQVKIEQGTDGSVSRVSVQDGQGKVEVSDVPKLMRGGMLIAGLVLMLLGGLGSLVGWKILAWVWRGTGGWLRWQWERVRGETLRR